MSAIDVLMKKMTFVMNWQYLNDKTHINIHPSAPVIYLTAVKLDNNE